MNVAVIAVGVLTVIAVAAFAGCVIAWRRCSEAAKQTRSTASLAGELIEIRDYMSKVDAWMKRVSQRELMRDRRGTDGRLGVASPGSRQSREEEPRAESHKDALRRRAGLTAGRPADHKRDNEVDDQ